MFRPTGRDGSHFDISHNPQGMASYTPSPRAMGSLVGVNPRSMGFNRPIAPPQRPMLPGVAPGPAPIPMPVRMPVMGPGPAPPMQPPGPLLGTAAGPPVPPGTIDPRMMGI